MDDTREEEEQKLRNGSIGKRIVSEFSRQQANENSSKVQVGRDMESMPESISLVSLGAVVQRD